MLRMYFGLSVVNTKTPSMTVRPFGLLCALTCLWKLRQMRRCCSSSVACWRPTGLTERIFRPYQPPLVALLGLMHLGVTRASVVFGGAGCGNQHSVHWWLAQALRSGPHQVGGQPGVCAVTTRRTRCCLRRTPGLCRIWRGDQARGSTTT
jgi:hypothetical protein